MVMVMIITAMIAGLAIAYVATTTEQQQMVSGSIDNASYEQAALSGFEMARAVLLANYTASTVGWDTQLTASNANSATYYANNPSFPSATSINAGVTKSLFQWCRNINYYGNTYFAKIEDNDDGDGNATNDADGVVKLTVEAWGGGNNPVSRTQQILLEGMVSYRKETYTPTTAVVTGGALKMWGASTIEGTLGVIYATGSVDVSGCSKTPAVSQGIYTSGTINSTAGQIGGAGANPGVEAPEVPSVDPSQHFDSAGFDLRVNGQVYSKTGATTWVLRGMANNTTAVAGWKYKIATKTWSNSGEPESGTIYVRDGNIDLDGNVGGADKAWVGTLLVMGTPPDAGNISVAGTGNAIMTPHSGGIAVMAYGNVSGAGNLTVNNGLVAAREQIVIGGNLQVVGSLIAESYTLGAFGLAVQEFGSAKITYNGGLTTTLTDGDPYIKILGFKKRIKARY